MSFDPRKQIISPTGYEVFPEICHFICPGCASTQIEMIRELYNGYDQVELWCTSCDYTNDFNSSFFRKKQE